MNENANTPMTLDQLGQMMQDMAQRQAVQDKRQAVQDKQMQAMMEKITGLSQAADDSASAIQESERKENVESKALENASRAFATLQQAEVAAEETLEHEAERLDQDEQEMEKEISRVDALVADTQQAEAQNKEFRTIVQGDLQQTANEFNRLESAIGVIQEQQAAFQEQQAAMVAAADEREAVLVNALENLNAKFDDTQKGQEDQRSAPRAELSGRDGPRTDNPRAARASNWKDRGPTKKTAKDVLQEHEVARFESIQRNMKTLILDPYDEQLVHCTKYYGDVAIKYPNDMWITPTSDVEAQLRLAQRQLINASIRFEDWNKHLRLICDEELNSLIRDDNGNLLSWPRAVYVLLQDVDFMERSFQVQEELYATWPKKGENLRDFFQEFLSKARQVTEFSIFHMLSGRMQSILCDVSTSLIFHNEIQSLNSIAQLAAYVRSHVHRDATYPGRKVRKADTEPLGIMALHQRTLRGADAFYCDQCNCQKCEKAKHTTNLKKGYCVNCHCSGCVKKQHRLSPKGNGTVQFRINQIEASHEEVPPKLDDEAQRILYEIEGHASDTDSDLEEPYGALADLSEPAKPEQLAFANLESYHLDEVTKEDAILRPINA